MKFKKIWLFLLCPFALAQADDILTHLPEPGITSIESPWFTGPLLAPSAHTVPARHYDVETYVNFFSFTGAYEGNWHALSTPNFYSLNLYVLGQVGLTSFLDFTGALQGFYQFTEGERSVQFGDIPFGFDIQLLNETPQGWWPSMKLGLVASAPTGKYKNADPDKLGTDLVGSGNWRPGVNLVLGRLYQVAQNHFFGPRLAFNYTVPTPLHVSNINTYGGAEGTSGTVFPGNYFWVDFGAEYNFTQRWAFAIDLYYQHWNKNRFKGNTGFIEPTVPAVVTKAAAEQFSIAPALEYNWSSYIGIIGGVWFTVGGRNSSRFITGSLAFNVYM